MLKKDIYKLVNGFSFYVRKAATDTLPKNWKLNSRTLYDHELLFVEQGKIMCTLEDKFITVEKGQILLLPPGKLHCFSTEGDKLIQTHIHFDFFFDDYSEKRVVSFGIINPNNKKFCENGDHLMISEDVYQAMNIPYKIKLDPVNAEIVKQLIYNLIDLQTSPSAVSILKSKNCINSIFEIILSEYGEKTKKTDEKNIFNLMNVLIERQVNTKFDIGTIANSIGYSPNHLSFIYKSKFGITPAKHHSDLRISKAKDYLSQEALSVTEISDALGFLSVADFSRFFKRYVGISPYYYRTKIKKERE